MNEELGVKGGIAWSLVNIGSVYIEKGDFKLAADKLEKALNIQKEIGVGISALLSTSANLYLAYKHLGKQYDEQEIYNMVKEVEDIGYELNYRLYELLQDRSYLEKANTQVREKVETMGGELKEKFLKYLIPRQIIAEWEKVQS